MRVSVKQLSILKALTLQQNVLWHNSKCQPLDHRAD